MTFDCEKMAMTPIRTTEARKDISTPSSPIISRSVAHYSICDNMEDCSSSPAAAITNSTVTSRKEAVEIFSSLPLMPSLLDFEMDLTKHGRCDESHHVHDLTQRDFIPADGEAECEDGDSEYEFDEEVAAAAAHASCQTSSPASTPVSPPKQALQARRVSLFQTTTKLKPKQQRRKATPASTSPLERLFGSVQGEMKLSVASNPDKTKRRSHRKDDRQNRSEREDDDNNTIAAFSVVDWNGGPFPQTPVVCKDKTKDKTHLRLPQLSLQAGLNKATETQRGARTVCAPVFSACLPLPFFVPDEHPRTSSTSTKRIENDNNHNKQPSIVLFNTKPSVFRNKRQKPPTTPSRAAAETYPAPTGSSVTFRSHVATVPQSPSCASIKSSISTPITDPTSCASISSFLSSCKQQATTIQTPTISTSKSSSQSSFSSSSILMHPLSIRSTSPRHPTRTNLTTESKPAAPSFSSSFLLPPLTDNGAKSASVATTSPALASAFTIVPKRTSSDGISETNPNKITTPTSVVVFHAKAVSSPPSSSSLLGHHCESTFPLATTSSCNQKSNSSSLSAGSPGVATCPKSKETKCTSKTFLPCWTTEFSTPFQPSRSSSITETSKSDISGVDFNETTTKPAEQFQTPCFLQNVIPITSSLDDESKIQQDAYIAQKSVEFLSEIPDTSSYKNNSNSNKQRILIKISCKKKRKHNSRPRRRCSITSLTTKKTSYCDETKWAYNDTDDKVTLEEQEEGSNRYDRSFSQSQNDNDISEYVYDDEFEGDDVNAEENQENGRSSTHGDLTGEGENKFLEVDQEDKEDREGERREGEAAGDKTAVAGNRKDSSHLNCDSNKSPDTAAIATNRIFNSKEKIPEAGEITSPCRSPNRRNANTSIAATFKNKHAAKSQQSGGIKSRSRSCASSSSRRRVISSSQTSQRRHSSNNGDASENSCKHRKGVHSSSVGYGAYGGNEDVSFSCQRESRRNQERKQDALRNEESKRNSTKECELEGLILSFSSSSVWDYSDSPLKQKVENSREDWRNVDFTESGDEDEEDFIYQEINDTLYQEKIPLKLDSARWDASPSSTTSKSRTKKGQKQQQEQPREQQTNKPCDISPCPPLRKPSPLTLSTSVATTSRTPCSTTRQQEKEDDGANDDDELEEKEEFKTKEKFQPLLNIGSKSKDIISPILFSKQRFSDMHSEEFILSTSGTNFNELTDATKSEITTTEKSSLDNRKGNIIMKDGNRVSGKPPRMIAHRVRNHLEHYNSSNSLRIAGGGYCKELQKDEEKNSSKNKISNCFKIFSPPQSPSPASIERKLKLRERRMDQEEGQRKQPITRSKVTTRSHRQRKMCSELILGEEDEEKEVKSADAKRTQKDFGDDAKTVTDPTTRRLSLDSVDEEKRTETRQTKLGKSGRSLKTSTPPPSLDVKSERSHRTQRLFKIMGGNQNPKSPKIPYAPISEQKQKKP